MRMRIIQALKHGCAYNVHNILNDLIEYMDDNIIDNDIICCFMQYFDWPYRGYHWTRLNNVKNNSLVKLVTLHDIKFDPWFLVNMMCNEPQTIKPIMDRLSNKLTYEFIKSIDISKLPFNIDELFKNLIPTYKVTFTKAEWDKFIMQTNVGPYAVLEYTKIHKNIIYEIMTRIVHVVDLKILKVYVQNDGILDDIILDNLCEYSKLPFCNGQGIDYCDTHLMKIRFILDNKIVPTLKTFNNILWNKYIDKAHIKTYLSTIITLLCDYGYVLTYDDVKNALKCGVIIKNIDKYNIIFDSTYLLLCSEIGIIPPYKTNIKYDMNYLNAECNKQNNFHKIKQICKTTNLLPDSKCMLSACNIKLNIRTIKYLVQKGCIVDIAMLEKTVNNMNNKQLTYIFEQFMIHNNILPKITPERIITEEKKEEKKEERKEEKKEEKVKQAKIPATYLHNTIVYNSINEKIKKCLNIKNKKINYINFRRIILEHVIDNTTPSTHIMLKKPFLYNGANTVGFNEINEWVYSLLYP